MTTDKTIFEQNKKKLEEELKNYIEKKSDFIPYYESMKKMNIWYETKRK